MKKSDNLLLFPAFPVEPPPTTPAAPPLADEMARRQALDTSASWIVEAPAGSGKTGLLMQRYLKLLASESTTHPDEVLAITFTRKATAELRERIFKQLESARNEVAENASRFDLETRALAEAVVERDHRLGWGLLENSSQLRVQTIDAVCSEIARTLPLLSGSGGSGTPVEDARPLYRLAARRTVMRLGGSDPVLHNALYTVLLRRDGNLGDCQNLLATMLAQREQWAELVPLDRASLTDDALESEVRPRLEENLQKIVCRGLTHALAAIPPDALHNLSELAHAISTGPDHPLDSPIAICASHATAPGAESEHQEHWNALAHILLTQNGTLRKSFGANHLQFTSSKAEQVHLKSIIDSLSDEASAALNEVRALPPARFPEDQWVIAKALFRLLLHALAELKVLFAERGECDFSELSLAAREALRNDGGAAGLANASGRTLRHLLVDEMQDTSSSQYELLELLTQSWDGGSQTVFLVGDPKQSIYIFRQARVERFLRTMESEKLGDLPLRALRLTANFRSGAPLVEKFNHDFSRIFPSPQTMPVDSNVGEVPFVSATAVRNDADGAALTWHASVLADKSPEAKREHALQEARDIRRIVEDVQARPLPEGRKKPWRIAVLARARNHLAPVLAEFQSNANGAPIPFRAVDVEELGERQEVLDVLALTRALRHPADRLAWLAVLRAPWCGLSAADLLALTGEGAIVSANDARLLTIPSLIVSRAAFLSTEGQELLRRVTPVLFAAQSQAGRGNFADLLRKTWHSLGADMLLLPEQRANVERYFDLLRDTLEPGARLDLRVLKEALRGLYAEPSSAPDAVDLMTIHKAKGLEWDFVIVPALERLGQASRYELLNWLELDDAHDGEASVLLAPIHETGEKPGLLSTWIRGVKTAREEAERKRLLYVACTRAREKLHLFGACERKKGGELTAPPGTLLRSFWPAAESHFAAYTQTYLGESWEEASDENGSDELPDEELLAIAAVAEEAAGAPPHRPSTLLRLPLAVDPTQRLRDAAAHRLPAPPLIALGNAKTFERPEGSFAIRAYGNTVHRFLELLAKRMAEGAMSEALLIELPSWQARLSASLRGEGLPPVTCARESARALAVLQNALSDPTGRWILSPQAGAASETALTLASEGHTSTMRVDRIFHAGSSPLSHGEDVLWIVDFKTAEQGSRTPERFAEEERAKYGPQLASYAALLGATRPTQRTIMLGLYYPAVPRLIHWSA